MSDPTLSSFSDESLTVYRRENWADRDPLLERAAQGNIRQIWHPEDWAANPRTRDYAEYLVATGIQSGVTASLIGRPGTVSAITALSFTQVHLDKDVAQAIFVLGQAALSKATALRLPSVNLSALAGDIASLTDHQKVILKWAAEGKSNRDIAEITMLSKRTIDYHMSKILKKLNVSSRAQAAVLLSGQ